MGYFVAAILTPAVVVVFATQVICSTNCTRACDDARILIDCNQSLILISDVTNLMMEKTRASFESIKIDCMGKKSCDPSRGCSKDNRQVLLVHYLCIDASRIMSKSCSRHAIQVTGNYGYIQSPEYPAATSTGPCTWEINPPVDSAVVLLLHDVVIKNNQDSCEGLLVSGQPCKDENTRDSFICGRDNITSLTRCGKVDITLRSRRKYDMRFWLSFHVMQKDRVPGSQIPASRCSVPNYDIGQGSEQSEKEPPTNSGVTNQDSNTEVLVIMLSIISGISAVLLIILIVVCVRCRLLQASHAESVYSDPSPSIQGRYEYISTSEHEKTRPQLAEGYFEVADVLPFAQRVDTPASPGYAEVEPVPDIKRMLNSSSSDECLGESKSLNEEKQCNSDLKITGDKETDIFSVGSENSRTKYGVVGRLKGERSKLRNKERKSADASSNVDSKIIPASTKKRASLDDHPVLSHAGLQTQTYSDDEGCSNYEPIEKCSPIKLSSNPNKTPPVHTNHPHSRRLSTDNVHRNSPTVEICGKTLNAMKDNANPYYNTVSVAESVPQLPDTTYSMLNSFQKTDLLSKRVSSNLSQGSKTLPSRNSTPRKQTPKVRNNDYKQSAHTDMPRASGIVKNGIKKFEQNSA